MVDDDLLKAFIRIARRKKNERMDKLMDEVDRLSDLDGIKLLRSEVLEFSANDPDFKQAQRTAAFLLGEPDAGVIEFVQFKPEPVTPAFQVYVVYSKDVPGTRHLTGKEKRVPDFDLCMAWRRAAAS